MKGKDTDGADKRVRKPSTLVKSWDAAFRGYINLNLTQQEKDAFEKWAASASYWEALEFNTSDGVNLSIKWVVREECFLASGTQRREDSPNAGLVVTARASSAGKALGRLLYCLTLLNRHERWEETQPLADPDRW